MPDQAPPPKIWGINNDYAPLRHVLLGKPEYYRWVEAGPLIGRTRVDSAAEPRAVHCAVHE